MPKCYVSVYGSDASGDGSASRPWRSLMYAVTKAAVGMTIRVGVGTFVENGLIAVPPGVSIRGSGVDQTIIKAAVPFYYHPAAPGYATDKFLLSLASNAQTLGSQTLSHFTIDGDAKQLHGGIYVRSRSAVTIKDIHITGTNFTGLWLWDVRSSRVKKLQLTNCSWGSAAWVSGALNIGNLYNVEIEADINENTGYGIKAIGPPAPNNLVNVSIRNSKVSVNPIGLWNTGTAPNIAIELWSCNLVECAIYNTYVDNTISLVNNTGIPSSGVQTIRVHHCTLDMDTRAQGKGYGMELSVNDAEIDHNYFLKGTYGIANWAAQMSNWSIHHNTFYALQGASPGDCLRSQATGIRNVRFYHNTVEFASDKTMNVIGLYGGMSSGLDVKNNVLIDSNIAYSFYPNQLIHLENGAQLGSLSVINNSFTKLPQGTVPGTYSGNILVDPQLSKAGVRPSPYYLPRIGSPLVGAAIPVGYGTTIGAYAVEGES